MKTLRQRLAFFPKLRLTGGHWVTVGVIVGLLSIEWAGRVAAPSDLGDGLAILALLVLLQICLVWHNYRGLRWLDAAASGLRRFGRWLTRFGIQSGIDLRGEPPVPQALPGPLKAGMLAACGVLPLLMLFNALAPSGWRAWVSQPSYLLYVVGLSAVWFATIFAIMFTVLMQLVLLQETLAAWRRRDARFPSWPRQTAWTFATHAGYLVTLLVLGWLLPVVVAVGLSVVFAAVLLLAMLMMRVPDATVLWQRKEGTRIRSCSLRRVALFTILLPVLVIWCLLAATLGAGALMLVDVTTSNMPITLLLGTLLAWCGAGFIAWLAGALIISMRTTQQGDPSRPAPPTLHITPVHDDVWEQYGEEVQQHLDEQGMRLRLDPAAPRRSDVPVELAPPPMPPLGGEEPVWPITISASALRAPELIHKLKRRDEVQRRRRLVRGLEKLFKHAAAQQFESGTGYLVAPHLWFISHLMRDSGEQGTETHTVGEPYHRVMEQPVRHHLYTVLRALQVDLIYVEDGVEFRQFRRVLRMLFEHYDIHGSALKAQDRFFTGIPGVRVIIEEHSLDNPFRNELYPEPEYRILARGRVLHVFRDRGDTWELDPTPELPKNEPLLVHA